MGVEAIGLATGVASPERSPEVPAVEVGKGKGAMCSWPSLGEGMRPRKFWALELEVSDEEEELTEEGEESESGVISDSGSPVGRLTASSGRRFLGEPFVLVADQCLLLMGGARASDRP
jgi:hypothetical protein